MINKKSKLKDVCNVSKQINWLVIQNTSYFDKFV